ncbi:hypothetical protein ACFPJ4_02460 [Lysinimonas soli]|uniref:DUF1109 domain-containing protein n=1 Tax=Lysinimonas soli TaxID=1074233 RepID=A0ABW0NPH0_9MICO
MTQPTSPRVRAIDVVWIWAVVVGASVPLVFLVALVVQIIVVNSSNRFVDLVGLAFAYSIVGAVVTCALIAVAVGKRPRVRQIVIPSAAIGVLAGLAPISAVVFLRLSHKACAVWNVLGLPWAEPWRDLAQWSALLIWLASTVSLIVAVTTPRIRRAGVAMWIWSAAIAVPTLFLNFLVVYGDPGPSCVPV